MNPRQFTGRVFVQIGGRRVVSDKSASMKLGNVKRNDVIGDDVYGFSVEKEAAEVKCDLFHNSGVSLAALQALDDTTVTFETDTGVVFVLANAWCMEIGELKDGKFALTFHAREAVEQGASAFNA